MPKRDSARGSCGTTHPPLRLVSGVGRYVLRLLLSANMYVVDFTQGLKELSARRSDRSDDNGGIFFFSTSHSRLIYVQQYRVANIQRNRAALSGPPVARAVAARCLCAEL